MSTKTCPSCGELVPAAAGVCKHCFYTFSGGQKRKNSGLLLLIGTIAAMVCVGAGVMYYVLNHQAVKRNVIIDEETRSVVWTTVSAEKTATERLSFDDVEKLELVLGGKHRTFEVVAVTHGGQRHILNESNEKNLKGYAQVVAGLMEKPLVEIKNIKGFGERYGED